MAITKGALEESILSKSEIAALRVLSRVSMLLEGIRVLRNYQDYVLSETSVSITQSPSVKVKVTEFEAYLNTAIEISLSQHRLPANTQAQGVKPQ
jgi:hypothetical protein